MVTASWAGHVAVVLATGPSLNVDDVEYVKGRAKVIAVNDAYRLAPWADALYASDQSWWAKHKGVQEFSGMRYSVSQSRKPKPFGGLPDVCVLANTGTAGLETDPRGLRTGKNSGFAAINLAVHFGVSRILLLGYNLGPVNRVRHFFGDHKGLGNHSPYHVFIQKFQTLVEPLQKIGVSVINCTQPTRLRCFPCQPLREALS